MLEEARDTFILAFRFRLGGFEGRDRQPWKSSSARRRRRLRARGVTVLQPRGFVMETSCQKCGAKVAADQAFCSKCGAVVGMSNAGQDEGGDWNLAATMVGKKLKATPTPRPSPSAAAAQPARPSAPVYT